MDNSRKEIASLISARLIAEKDVLKKQFSETKNNIGYFFLDDVLPEEIALEIHKNFPKLSEAALRKDIREHKYIAYQMDKYHSLLEEVIYAFQDAEIVGLIAEICQIKEALPDENLYAGGLSLMKKNNFLNPHLDNSHDKDRKLWRVLNLLFYVTPNWNIENGGNLEIWPKGIKNEPREIESKFNRLVVMATHQHSWHSVNKVLVDKVRCCISNYYFSETPLLPNDSFHVTSFRGRKTEKIKDFFLRTDSLLRNSIRTIFKNGLRENPHKYKK